MKIEDIEGAANLDKAAIRRALTKIQTWLSAAEGVLGIDPLAAPGGGKLRVTPPPLCAFTVSAFSPDAWIVQIQVNPELTGPVLHQLKTSETAPFKASTTIITYTDNPSTQILVSDAGLTTLGYFQIRSRFYTSDYNAPQVISTL